MNKKTICFILAGFLLANMAAAEVYNREIITNGDFEDQLNGWDCSNCNADENIAYDDIYYTHYLALGNVNETEQAKQTVAIAADTGKADFSFDCELITADSLDNDYFSFSIQNHDTQEVYIKENVFPTDNSTSCDYSYNLKAYAGQTLDIIYSVSNDAGNLTYAAIDDVTLVEKSYATMRGRIFDKHYNKLKNATVVIKKFNGEKLWTGTTNTNGIFKATHLKGNPYYKAFIYITKNGVKEKFRRYLDWGESYHRNFRTKII